MKVKICGITNTEDAIFTSESGAWALGFIFVKNTPRYIEPDKAAEIIKNLSQEVYKVGVFADSSLEQVIRISEITGIDKIQLHGEESPEYCSKIDKTTGKKIIKAIKIKNQEDLNKIPPYKNCVSFILLDTFIEGKLGGSGKIFDWKIALYAKEFKIPVILAGGLNPDNIIHAYNEVKPFALDISSGLEKEKGIKDPEKLKKLKRIIFSVKKGTVI